MRPNTKKSTLGYSYGKALRKYQSLQDMSEDIYEDPLPKAREASISEKFGALSVMDTKKAKEGVQVTSNSIMLPPPAFSVPPNVSVRKKGNSKIEHVEASMEESRRDLVVPATPGKQELMDSLELSIKAIKKTPRAAMSPSPTKGPYLSKYSNITGYVVTEIEEKIGKMDSEFQKLKEIMNATEMSSTTVKEELEMAKKRGEPFVLVAYSLMCICMLNHNSGEPRRPAQRVTNRKSENHGQIDRCGAPSS